MKKPLLITTTLFVLALSATSIYAQVTTGTSIVDKMKAAAHSFTLSSVLNPTETGLTSDPIKGKKTGGILTAGEWNRVLELVSEGGSGGGSGWVDVPLTDTNPFDEQCMYRVTITGGIVRYASGVHPDQLFFGYNLNPGWIGGYIQKGTKATFATNSNGNFTVSKLEKLCGGGGGSGVSASPTCPSGFVAIGSYCIEPTMSSTGKTWYEAAVACTDKGVQLCHWSEWSAACLKGKLTDVTFGASGKYEWIDDYYIGNQGIADPIVHSDCKYLSRQADTTAAANTGYRCCTSQK